MTHHPPLHCCCWVPVDATVHFSDLILTDPLVVSSLSFAAASPALKSGERHKKRALKQHSDNDQVDTAILKHACLKFYGPLKQYLWTKCNFKNSKHCITHYIIIRDQINPKQNQCKSPLAPLKPRCTEPHLPSLRTSNLQCRFIIFISKAKRYTFPWFRHQLVYAWCAITLKSTNEKWKMMWILKSQPMCQTFCWRELEVVEIIRSDP